MIKIKHIEPIENNRLRVSFDDGVSGIIDMKDTISVGGVFSKLSEIDFFKKVKISDDGRYIVWPEEIDFCADALYVEVKVDSTEPVLV